MIPDKRGIAFFDFDGTVTRLDTLWDFHKFAFGATCFYRKVFFLLPVLFAYAFRMISAQAAKEAVLSVFWKGKALQTLEEYGQKYAGRVPDILRKEAVQAIRRHKENGDVLVLVTASIREWVEPWAKTAGFHFVLASEIEVEDGRITGRLQGANCTGPEKEKQIRKTINLDDFEEIYAYGDSEGDREMLSLGTKGKTYYKWRVAE
jgi:HAD superfamily hydrolase (TIGR01490 family)